MKASLTIVAALGLVVALSPGHRAAGAAPGSAGEWDAAAETLVVYNEVFAGSGDLARYYARARGIPGARVLGLRCALDETISREKFESTIREPLLRHLIDKKWWTIEKRDLVDPQGKRFRQVPQVVKQEIRVVVLIRGMPIRVERVPSGREPGPGEMDEASVDSEVAALGLLQRPIRGPLENRYYRSKLPFPEVEEARGQLLVGRLDAADDATVRRMIDDTIRVEKGGLWGRAVVDFSKMDGGYEEGEQWLDRCVQMYRAAGVPVFSDPHPAVIRESWPLPDTALYFGWYTSKVEGALASPEFQFKPGAIACHLHSFSAAVLRTKTEHWVGPLLEKGAAAALGNVWEPYLTLTVHFDVLNARLLSGATLGEAAWAASPGLSWMNVVVGDPLYRPFPGQRSARRDGSKDEDYAVYASLAGRSPALQGAELRRQLLRLAETKRNAHLLEILGLLSASEGKRREAVDFFQHAGAWYKNPEDQVRCFLYEAEIARRNGDVAAARAVVQKVLDDSRLAGTLARSAAASWRPELN